MLSFKGIQEVDIPAHAHVEAEERLFHAHVLSQGARTAALGIVVVHAGGDEGMEAYVAVALRTVEYPYAGIAFFLSRQGKLVPIVAGALKVQQLIFRVVNGVGCFAEERPRGVQRKVGARDNTEALADVVSRSGLADKVYIDVERLVGKHVAQGQIGRFIFAEATAALFEDAGRVECLEVSEVATPQQVVGEEVAAVGTVMYVGRVGQLQAQGVVAVIGGVCRRGSQLEAVEVVPIVAVEEHIDGSGIVLVATHGQGILTKTYREVPVGLVVEVEEVGVVEEARAAFVGYDALTEVVAEFVCKVAAHVQVEVSALETGVGVGADEVALQGTLQYGLIAEVEIGTCLQSQGAKKGFLLHIATRGSVLCTAVDNAK